MKFKADIQLIDFDRRSYLNYLDLHMQRMTREAARSWLTTVLVIIPTWSRASRATFEALASAVSFNIQYGPIRSFEDRLVLGLQTGRGGVDYKKGQWYFYYETDLRYLAYNEHNRVIFGQAPGVFSPNGLINDTPYKFQEAGKADFESFASNVLLPSPMDYIKGRRI